MSEETQPGEPVVISVRGEAEREVGAERGTARIAVRSEGGDRGAVLDDVAVEAAAVRARIEQLHDEGAVTTWTSEQLSAWSTQPYGDHGRRLAPRQHAAVNLRAEFGDFAALGRFVAEFAEHPLVVIEGIDWTLTPATERRVESDVAASAVHQALARATAYAAALGLTDVRPLAVADLGLLDPGSGGGPTPRMMMASASFDRAGDDRPDIDLRPGDITVRAAVEARFTAR